MSLIYFAFAVIFYTFSQLQQHGKINHWGKFWNESSWMNKYSYGSVSRKERFPLSTTLLVFVTDGYHLSQMLFKVSLCAAIVSYKPIFGPWDLALYFFGFGFLFTIVYKIASK